MLGGRPKPKLYKAVSKPMHLSQIKSNIRSMCLGGTTARRHYYVVEWLQHPAAIWSCSHEDQSTERIERVKLAR